MTGHAASRIQMSSRFIMIMMMAGGSARRGAMANQGEVRADKPLGLGTDGRSPARTTACDYSAKTVTTAITHG
jgi:hypothetical protein